MIRIAAVGDIHVGVDSVGRFRPHWQRLNDDADAFLIAGDLTRWGEQDEVSVLIDELEGVSIPIVAILGNHDYHRDQHDAMEKLLRDAGVVVLDGDSVVLEFEGTTVGVAGTKGFGGGFAGASGSEFGEPEMKAFMRHTREISDQLQAALQELQTDMRIALLHYSPIEDTLHGERLEIYPFMGSYLLAEAIDAGGADLVIHGHAHAGREKGATPGGIQVRNVAQPVLRHAYALYCFSNGERNAC